MESRLDLIRRLAKKRKPRKARPPKYKTGDRFGQLELVLEQGMRRGDRRWLCKCDCGVEKVISQGSMASGRVVSCGCYRREMNREMLLRNPIAPKIRWHRVRKEESREAE